MLEQRIAAIEQEWPQMLQYFRPYDRYVSHSINVDGHCLDYVLESMIVPEDTTEQ
ncbi:MAG: hypothetical protein ACR2IF_06660 [Terriglobales bacterium]